MHIEVEKIFLEELSFILRIENIENRNVSINIDCDSRFPESNLLVQKAKFDLGKDDETAPFELSFTFVGHYRKVNSGEPTLEEFSKYNAPAYLVPYARELIANITSRVADLPTLVIPPVNIIEALEESRRLSEQPTLGLEQDSALSEDQAE